MKNLRFAAVAVIAVLLLMSIPFIYFSSDPPMGNATSTDSREYMDVDPYIKRLLKKSYIDPLPARLPDECEAEYYYNYKCNFDGEMFFTIYLKRSSMQGDELEAEMRRLYRLGGAQISRSGDVESICFCMPDLEEYFSESVSQKGFRFDIVMADRGKGTIQYLVSYQHDNRHVPEVVVGMLAP